MTTPPSTVSPTVKPDVDVTYSGWLEKQAEWRFAWNKRFFTLCGTTLSYHIEGNEADKKCALVECLQKNAGAPNTLRVWTERGGCWVLRASSEQDHRGWVEAIAQVLHENPRQEEVLSGTVLKCSAWTKSWRSRYVMVKGLQLSYSEAQGQPVKNKYVVASADRCFNDNELRIGCTNGETFLLKFADRTETDLWLHTIRQAQRRMHTLRWQTVPLSGDGKWHVGSLLHSAACFEGKYVVLFGGGVILPNQSKALQRELVTTSLVGDHPATLVHPDAFEEGPGAKVKPLARELSACAFLDSGKFVLFGGTASTPGDVFGDAWVVHIAARGPWQRLWTSEEPLITRRFGHSIHGAGIEDAFFVMGGLDNRFNALADVFKCVLCPNGGVTVTRQADLDLPRGMHSGVSLANGTHVLIGGCNGKYGGSDEVPAENSLHTSLSVLPKGGSRWMTVPLQPPLPSSTLNPAAAAHGATIFVWCCGKQAKPFLAGVSVVGDFAIVTEYATRGDVPSVPRGLTMHIGDGFAYVFGSSCSAAVRLLLPTNANQERSESNLSSNPSLTSPPKVSFS